MKHSTFFTLLILLAFSSLQAQQLPSNPDPNKCYVRSVTADVYEVEYDDVLTYSQEEAELYPHRRLKIELKPEISQWETTAYEGCESDNPNDCQVLCYRTYSAEFETIYRPKDKTLGKPFYKEIERMIMVERGGLSSYEEIDCALTSYNVLPIEFKPKSAAFEAPDRAREAIDDRLLDLMYYERPNIRIQINAHTDSHGGAAANQLLSEQRVGMVIDYLISEGINPGRLVGRGYGESQLKNRCADGVNCTDWEHSVNSRLEFRVLNIDQ